ncbi:hypothetical protein LTR36_001930, partial [Oleoguttula mirabilis]
MVATRNHPKDFEPSPTDSPGKRSTRTSTEPSAAAATDSPSKRFTRTVTKPEAADSPAKRIARTSLSTSTTSTTTASTANRVAPTPAASPPQPPPPRPRTSASSAATTRTTAPTSMPPRRSAAWSHTPSNLTLIWLAISLPLVIWDTGYVMLRPYSMPGGFLHAPLWKPYGLYGTIDHVYGFKAYNAHNGWTLAQGSVNAVETAAYLLYLYLVYAHGEQAATQGRGAPDKAALGRLRGLGESRTVHGRVAAGAVVLAYSTAWLTFSKTVLYWLTEAFSGFDNIGHNDPLTLFFMWIIPNGAWLVFPAYMMYVFGQEILQGLELAAAGAR